MLRADTSRTRERVRSRRQGPRIARFVAVLVMATSCTIAGRSRHAVLAEPQALALAVELANRECSRQYSIEPFDASTYALRFTDGRWHWGQLDAGGPRGYSAAVSFDSYGESRQVEVRFHIDTL